jgi:hypothetical protein
MVFVDPSVIVQSLLKDMSKQGVCHIVALPFTIKKYLKAKEEELWKLEYFTMPKYMKLLYSIMNLNTISLLPW